MVQHMRRFALYSHQYNKKNNDEQTEWQMFLLGVRHDGANYFPKI